LSFVCKKLIPALTVAALITTVSIAGAATASARIIGTGYGSGSTVAAAEMAAKRDLISNYRGCSLPPEYYVDGSAGSYTAEAVSSCLDAS